MGHQGRSVWKEDRSGDLTVERCSFEEDDGRWSGTGGGAEEAHDGRWIWARDVAGQENGDDNGGGKSGTLGDCFPLMHHVIAFLPFLPIFF